MTINALIEKHSNKSDLHIARVMGSFVVISEGQIVEVDRTHALTYCPLHALLGKQTIEEYTSEKIRQFGHFTAGREIRRSSFGVPFGTSEMFMYALRKKALDCAVVVCDGAGTVVTANPEIVQGIGARMNGLFYTTPIPHVQNALRESGCSLLDNAVIDQYQGLAIAIANGYSRIGVTVNGLASESLARIRQAEKEAGVTVTVATVCTTGIEDRTADDIVTHSDLAWACASKHMRNTGRKALLQVTLGIPIFAYTRNGLRILASYSDEATTAIPVNLDLQRQYLVSSTPGGRKVQLGKKMLYLTETVLPVAGKHSPYPTA